MRLESRRPFGTKSSSSQIPEKHITNDTYIYSDAPCMVYMYLHLGDFCRKGWYIFHNYMEHMGSSSTRIPSLFLLVKPLPPWLVQSPVPSQLENHAHPGRRHIHWQGASCRTPWEIHCGKSRALDDCFVRDASCIYGIPGLVNIQKANWKIHPFYSWVNQLFRLGHFQ